MSILLYPYMGRSAKFHQNGLIETNEIAILPALLSLFMELRLLPYCLIEPTVSPIPPHRSGWDNRSSIASIVLINTQQKLLE